MPIPIEDLNKAAKPLPERIIAFLAADRANAYSIDEIYLAVERVSDDDWSMLLIAWTDERNRRLKPYVDALQALVKDRKVVVGKVRETQYFSLPTK